MSLNTTTNILYIDLSSYSTSSASDLRYQKLFTASLPLSLNSTTNALTIDLSAYQKLFTASLPLSSNSTTNASTIDLSTYQKSLTVTSTTTSPLTLNATTNALTIDLCNYATIASTSGSYQPKLTVTTTTASPLIFSNNTLSIDLGIYYQISSKTVAERYSDSINTYGYLDTICRTYSDKVDFYIQKNGISLAQFGYNSTTLKSTFYMNGIDILVLIASKTIDLTNLRTTPTTNINFINSYGAAIAYFDDGATFTTYGILTNSGGATFTKGLTVSAGASISYDASHMLEITATGATITGDLSVTGALKATAGLVSNSITIGGSVSPATVAVTGSGAYSQDLSAKSIKFTGAQLPIVNTLDVTGVVSMPGYMWAAGTVSATGTKLSGTGQMSWTVSRVSTGIYTISWTTAHPLGAYYVVNITGQRVMCMVRNTVAPTSTSFQVVLYTIGTVTVFDGVFSFMVLAS